MLEGQGPVLRDEIRGQEGNTSRLPMSHRLIDPQHFFKFQMIPTLRKLEKKTFRKQNFPIFLKLGFFKQLKYALDPLIGVT